MSSNVSHAKSREIAARMVAIKQSGLFHPDQYTLRVEAAFKQQDPVFHYLTTGEARGAKPSVSFDPVYYSAKHGINGDSPLIHYILIGRGQGLRTLPLASSFRFLGDGFRTERKRIVLLFPQVKTEASQELALKVVGELRETHNVVAVVLSDSQCSSDLLKLAALVAAPCNELGVEPFRELLEASYLVEAVVGACNPDAVMCLDTASHKIVRCFVEKFVPAIALLSEDGPSQFSFATYDLYRYSAAILFRSEQLKEQQLRRYPWLAGRRTDTIELELAKSDRTNEAAQVLKTSLDYAREKVSVLKEKYEQIVSNDQVFKEIRWNFADPINQKKYLREVCIATGLSTGVAPAFWGPKLISGFDEQAFVAEHPDSCGSATIDYLLAGRLGEFIGPMIFPPTKPVEVGRCRVALHGHFFYPEMVEELISALSANTGEIDLYLSTNSEEKKDLLNSILQKQPRRYQVRLFPNIGRDLGAFLTGFRDLLEGEYDVVGHVHGKKSPQVWYGDSWRQSLLRNVIGGPQAMADVVISHFSGDDRLGLVFPENVKYHGWDLNGAHAKELAGRMGLGEIWKVPCFDFPTGSFFWCRPSALKPLIDLKLDWHDYPKEPVPIDGSMLHAIERVLPFVCKATGYRLMTTVVQSSAPDLSPAN